MNLSKNFKTLQPGRYQNSIDRTVDVVSVEENVPDPAAPNDPTRLKQRWTGLLRKQDGKTTETTQLFEADGSLWGQRGISHPHDLKLLNYAFDVETGQMQKTA